MERLEKVCDVHRILARLVEEKLQIERLVVAIGMRDVRVVAHVLGHLQNLAVLGQDQVLELLVLLQQQRNGVSFHRIVCRRCMQRSLVGCCAQNTDHTPLFVLPHPAVRFEYLFTIIALIMLWLLFVARYTSNTSIVTERVFIGCDVFHKISLFARNVVTLFTGKFRGYFLATFTSKYFHILPKLGSEKSSQN